MTALLSRVRERSQARMFCLTAAVPLLALFPLHKQRLCVASRDRKWIVAHHAVPRDDIFSWTRYMRGMDRQRVVSQTIFLRGLEAGR